MSPSKCRCSSPFGNLMSCSLLTFCLYSLSCLSYGDVICGTSTWCLVACTTIGITYTIVGTIYTIVGIVNGATLPSLFFYALTFMLLCSLLPKPKASPSSTFIFLLRALLGDSAISLFLFSNVICISSLVFFTLAGCLCGFSFWWTNKYWKIFANTNAN